MEKRISSSPETPLRIRTLTTSEPPAPAVRAIVGGVIGRERHPMKGDAPRDAEAPPMNGDASADGASDCGKLGAAENPSKDTEECMHGDAAQLIGVWPRGAWTPPLLAMVAEVPPKLSKYHSGLRTPRSSGTVCKAMASGIRQLPAALSTSLHWGENDRASAAESFPLGPVAATIAELAILAGSSERLRPHLLQNSESGVYANPQPAQQLLFV